MTSRHSLANNNKLPTVYDVAKLANVSASTVSRFLNRSAYVSDEKTLSIEKAMQALGYKPELSNIRKKNRRSMMVGVLVQNPDSPHTSRILNDMEKKLSDHGYSLVIASGQWRSRVEMDALSYLVDSHVDGIIIVAGNIEPEKIIEYSRKTPIVAAGYEAKAENLRTISLDNVLGGYMATLHLLQQGHVNIAHIRGIELQPDADDRFKGYKKALQEAGLAVLSELIQMGDFSSESGYEKTIELLESNIPFSAIFAANDLTAYGAIKALHDRGYHVPNDVAVIGFDDLPTSRYFTPALTTLRQPVEEMGALCATSIIDLLNGGDKDIPLPPIDLIVRESTVLHTD